MARRILSIWLPRLSVERRLREDDRALLADAQAAPPLATLAQLGSALRVSDLTASAEQTGVRVGQAAADARALCPALRTRMADPTADALLLERLARWAGRYAPLAAIDRLDDAEAERDLAAARRARGLSLDVSGAAHLFGGERALLDDLLARLERLGFTAAAALADAKGAAWALSRFGSRGGAIVEPGETPAALKALPLDALRLPPDVVEGLARVGFRTIADLYPLPRAALARRFGVKTVDRLDQALGAAPEPITPLSSRPRFAARLSLPEPIGLEADLRAGLERLLAAVCAKLDAAQKGARRLRLSLRRVDRASLTLEVGLARPRRDGAFIAALFEKRFSEIDAGYGVDAMRLEATVVDPLGPTQTHAGPEVSAAAARRALGEDDALAGLLSRLGGRVGFENLLRLRPGESHAPHRAVIAETAFAPTAAGPPAPLAFGVWAAAAAARPPRPLERFAPEPVAVRRAGAPMRPPEVFGWRGEAHETAFAAGPERIAPEWWFDDPLWRDGVRDYWRVETRAGARIWMFVNPKAGEADAPWFVVGRFL